MPFDALVGAYYPWLDFKWGYTVGVPFKNIALSDVFSQLYPWRVLAINYMKQGQWPLWNPYSFSGMPLLANWQSAPFYPSNILMLIFGNVWGWVLMIISQPILSLLFMYLYLKKIGINTFGVLIGSVIFAFSGFMMTYLEYATIGQVVLWLPLQLYLIEIFYRSKNIRILAIYALTFFPVLTGGFFQPAIYVLFVSITYAIFRLKNIFAKNLRIFSLFLTLIILGLLTSSLQIIPTFELFNNSIRLFDQNIIEYQYGLLPLRNFIGFLSPDFFGNPSTNNFWGFLQYQETSGYFGIISILFVITAIFHFRKSFYHKYFSVLFLISLLFAFNNPFAGLIYNLNFPGLSGGYASRILILTSFSAAVLAALGSETLSYKKILKFCGVILSVLVVLILTFTYKTIIFESGIFKQLLLFFGIAKESQLKIANHNMIPPLIFVVGYFFITLFFVNYEKFNIHLKINISNKSIRKIFLTISLLFISIDLVRYSVKFTPFSKVEMLNLSSPVITYLQNNIMNFRIEREWGPVLPPNTWIYSGLSSPSGYDPLTVLSYARWFALCQYDRSSGKIDISSNKYTRYLEVDKYDSPCIDFSGVKYLIAIKRDSNGNYSKDGNYFNKNISTDKYKEVYSYGTTAVLENKDVFNRVIFYDNYLVEKDGFKAQDKAFWDLNLQNSVVIDQKPLHDDLSVSSSDKAKIVNYNANKVEINSTNLHPVILVLTDVYYPGWEVFVDDNKTSLLKADGVYKAVELPEGEHNVVFKYNPLSFKVGLASSMISIFILLLVLLYGKRYIKIGV